MKRNENVGVDLSQHSVYYLITQIGQNIGDDSRQADSYFIDDSFHSTRRNSQN